MLDSRQALGACTKNAFSSRCHDETSPSITPVFGYENTRVVWRVSDGEHEQVRSEQHTHIDDYAEPLRDVHNQLALKAAKRSKPQ